MSLVYDSARKLRSFYVLVFLHSMICILSKKFSSDGFSFVLA